MRTNRLFKSIAVLAALTLAGASEAWAGVVSTVYVMKAYVLGLSLSGVECNCSPGEDSQVDLGVHINYQVPHQHEWRIKWFQTGRERPKTRRPDVTLPLFCLSYGSLLWFDDQHGGRGQFQVLLEV